MNGEPCGSWMPAAARARSIGRQDLNIWEASWCGNDLIVAVAGTGTDEGAWYDAPLVAIDPTTGADRVLTSSDVQLGWAQGSPDGREVAVIEAVCSDRYVVAGQLLLVDPASGARRQIDTAGVDVSWSEWRGARPVVRDRAARTRHRGLGGGHRIRRCP